MELQTIKQMLPHGAMNKIALKAGVSASEVSRIFGGLVTKNNANVLKATAEFLAEHKAKENEAVKAFNEALNPESPEQLIARLNHQREKYGDSSSPLL